MFTFLQDTAFPPSNIYITQIYAYFHVQRMKKVDYYCFVLLLRPASERASSTLSFASTNQIENTHILLS